MGRRRRSGTGSQMFEKGVLAICFGGALLLAPLIIGNSPVLRPLVHALQMPAWLLIAAGAALIGLGWLVQNRRHASSPIAKHALHGQARPGSPDMFPPDIQDPPGQPRRMLDQAAASASRFPVTRAKQQQWNKQVFEDIEWRRFEAVCERLFAQGGFEARSQSHGADGGVDIWLYSKNAQGPAAVVQCKHWAKPVGVKEVREFFGVMASKGLARGTFATTSTFTAAATEFAKANGINPLDGDGLLALIARRSQEQQQDLLAVAYDGEYWRPTCPSCGVKLVDRESGKDKSHFWGCTNFPRCRTKINMRAA